MSAAPRSAARRTAERPLHAVRPGPVRRPGGAAVTVHTVRRAAATLVGRMAGRPAHGPADEGGAAR